MAYEDIVLIDGEVIAYIITCACRHETDKPKQLLKVCPLDAVSNMWASNFDYKNGDIVMIGGHEYILIDPNDGPAREAE